jgi:hypothetical protein
MKFASVLSAALVAASAMSMPALADSNGVTLYCGIEGTAKVSIKADNRNDHPMKCTANCMIKDGAGQSVEVKISDKAVAGPDSSYQTLLEQEMPNGPYTPSGLDYNCSNP